MIFFNDGDSDSFDDACGLAFFNDKDAVVCLTMHARAKMRRLMMGLLFFVLMLFCDTDGNQGCNFFMIMTTIALIPQR